MNAPVLAQVTLSTEDAIIYAPRKGQQAKITNIRISPNDTVTDYTITVTITAPGKDAKYLYVKGLSLTAGDWLNDSSEYHLSYGQSITALCSEADLVDIVINGEVSDLVIKNQLSNP